MSAPADVTVVIPAHDAEATLGETLRSIRAQTLPVREIVVVDDGSTDATAAVAEAFGPPVRVIRQPPSGGPATGRNRGVREARTRWVAFFDADDLMEPDKIRTQIEALERHGGVASFTEFRRIDVSGSEIDDGFVARYRDFRQKLEPLADDGVHAIDGRALYPELVAHNFIGTSSVVASTDALRAVGPFDESLPNGDDREMWYRLARAGGRFLFVDRPCHRYRVRSGSITAGGARRLPAQIEVLRRQRPHLRQPGERTLYRDRMHTLLLGLGRAEIGDGRRLRALVAFVRAFATRPSARALRGIARSCAPF